MVIANLTDAELVTVRIALKYWRSHRCEGDARKADHLLTSAEFDVLLTKLGAEILATLPPDDVIADLFSR